ncbi:membrane-spanning 4-domains subfamily A member 5-like [Pleurodeles waltl]
MASPGTPQKSGMESTLNLIPEKPSTFGQQQHVPPQSPKSNMQQNSQQSAVFAMGVVQIIVGAIHIIFGGLLRTAYVGQTSITLLSKVPSWAGVMFIVSGAFSLSAHQGRSRNHLIVTLVLNIIAAVEAVAAVVIFSFDLTSHSYDICMNEGVGVAFNQCKMYRAAFLVLEIGSLLFLLTLALLEFCISVATSVFTGMWLRGNPSSSHGIQPQRMEYNAYAQGADAPSVQAVGPPPDYYANLSEDGKWPSYGTTDVPQKNH